MTTLDIPAPTRVGPNSNGLVMTPEEFDAIDDWDRDYVYELVHGVLIVSPAPGAGERSPNEELGYWLRLYRDTHSKGKCLDQTLYEQYVRTDAGRRLADRALWVGLGRPPDVNHDTPTITVEFTSESARDRRRDYIVKRQEHIDAGVQEYWVIDRFDRTMTVFFADGTHRVIGEQETYATPLLPGFELPLGRLLAVADECVS